MHKTVLGPLHPDHYPEMERRKCLYNVNIGITLTEKQEHNFNEGCSNFRHLISWFGHSNHMVSARVSLFDHKKRHSNISHLTYIHIILGRSSVVICNT